MLGQELAVEQFESADLQARDQISERDLGRVIGAAEHALAEKGAAQPHAVEAADQLVARPGFDRMGIAAAMQLRISDLDIGIDPGVGAACGRLGTVRHHRAEGAVDRHRITVRPDRLGERVREVEAVEREDATFLGLDPEDVVGIAGARHREYPDGVSAQQQVRIQRGHRAQIYPDPPLA